MPVSLLLLLLQDITEPVLICSNKIKKIQLEPILLFLLPMPLYFKTLVKQSHHKVLTITFPKNKNIKNKSRQTEKRADTAI